MQRNHPIVRLYVALGKEGKTVSVPVASSGLCAMTLPVAPPALTQWHRFLSPICDVALQPSLARLTGRSLGAALRLLPPDFSIVVILADLCGWDGL